MLFAEDVASLSIADRHREMLESADKVIHFSLNLLSRKTLLK